MEKRKTAKDKTKDQKVINTKKPQTKTTPTPTPKQPPETIKMGVAPFDNPMGTNSCFVNIVVQILYHSISFREEVLKMKLEGQEKKNPIYQLKVKFT